MRTDDVKPSGRLLVEVLLCGGFSRPVWASGPGGAVTERLHELAGPLARV